MRYNDIKKSVVQQFKSGGFSRVPYLEGAPGGGKSACAADIMRELGVPQERLVTIHASLYEPCDVLGLPDLRGEFVKWLPAEMFYRIRREVKGMCGLIIEELPDALVPMQNALCGVIYDRRAGQLNLSQELAIIATGNRVKDKSGANRIVSKLANRVSLLEFDEHLDDWAQWALMNDVNPIIIQFLRFRPEHLSKFEPDRFANPTPRSWERVARIPQDMSEDLFFEHVKGEVSAGPATEFFSFRKIYLTLPDVDKILEEPKKAPVPTDPATQYALVGSLARKATVQNMSNLVDYLERMPPEFSVLCVKDAIALNDKLTMTPGFGKWTVKHAHVLT